jgi:short subunit dehydrogenase-like uncharacterized protein
MREFDIIIWGATGFVGRLVANQLFSRYQGRGLRWALGGRNQARLEAVRAELGSAATDIPIVTGDSHDVTSLDALITRTKVVCTTVGPYAKHGSDLVKACVRSGTHYCDVTGEVHWMRKMIDAHQAEAEQTGARIVSTCGFDSIPSDIGVFFLQRKAKELDGQPCSHIKMRVKAMRGGFSGGTRASMIYGIKEGMQDPSVKRVMGEPYGLNPEGQRQGPEAPEKMMAVKYDGDLKAWTMPFFMSPVNTKVVRRSNALLGYPYGKDFRYEEAMLLGSGLVSWAALLRKLLLPKPGQGPSQRVREKGYFDLILVGKLADGDVMRARVKGVGDPGTGATSKMLVESVVCLSQDSDNIEVGGGFWTPASAMGKLLLSRLRANAGLSFELES